MPRGRGNADPERGLAGFRRSVGYALSGLSWMLANERNAPMHLAHAVTCAFFCAWTGMPPAQAATALIPCGVAFAAECANSAIEATANAVTGERREWARTAKDCASAAVLVSVALLVVTDCLVVVPAVGGAWMGPQTQQ